MTKPSNPRKRIHSFNKIPVLRFGKRVCLQIDMGDIGLTGGDSGQYYLLVYRDGTIGLRKKYHKLTHFMPLRDIHRIMSVRAAREAARQAGTLRTPRTTTRGPIR